MAVANASRTYMPLEYSFTGRSRNSPMSANAAIEGSARAISPRLSPMISPLRKTFPLVHRRGLLDAPAHGSPPVAQAFLPARRYHPMNRLRRAPAGSGTGQLIRQNWSSANNTTDSRFSPTDRLTSFCHGVVYP